VRPGPRIATVVVNYRHADDTVRCLVALQASDHLDQRIIVVDNTERDNASRVHLADLLDPCVEVLDAGGNIGFAAGCNIGIQAALAGEADYVWLVNPDAVVWPDTLSSMLAVAEEHPDAGIVGARILDGSTPPRILFNGGLVDAVRKGATSHEDAGRFDRDVPDGVVRDVDYVTGACFLIRRGVLDQVGLIPEDYFLYFEETDFCLRVRAAGWRTVMAPRARVWHFKRSTGELPEPYYIYYMCRNRVLFSQRFFGADAAQSQADMGEFLGNWRKRVEAHAPNAVPSFDALVELAFEDARAGRVGRRDDIDTRTFA
jgi:GT2 family glycosyltransferase